MVLSMTALGQSNPNDHSLNEFSSEEIHKFQFLLIQTTHFYTSERFSPLFLKLHYQTKLELVSSLNYSVFFFTIVYLFRPFLVYKLEWFLLGTKCRKKIHSFRLQSLSQFWHTSSIITIVLFSSSCKNRSFDCYLINCSHLQQKKKKNKNTENNTVQIYNTFKHIVNIYLYWHSFWNKSSQNFMIASMNEEYLNHFYSHSLDVC